MLSFFNTPSKESNQVEENNFITDPTESEIRNTIEKMMTVPGHEASLFAGAIRDGHTFKKIEEKLNTDQPLTLDEFVFYTLITNDITKIDPLKLEKVIYQMYNNLIIEVEKRHGNHYPLYLISYNDPVFYLEKTLITSLLKTLLGIKRSYLQNNIIPLYNKYLKTKSAEDYATVSQKINTDTIVLSLYDVQPLFCNVYDYEVYYKEKKGKRVASLPVVENIDTWCKKMDKLIFKNCNVGLTPDYMNLSGGNFSYLSLVNKYRNLSSVNLENATLDFARLDGRIKLSDTNVKNASMMFVSLCNSVFKVKKLSQAKAYGCNFLYSKKNSNENKSDEEKNANQILDEYYATMEDAPFEFIEQFGLWLAQQTVAYLKHLLDQKEINVQECLDFVASIKSHNLFLTQGYIQYAIGLWSVPTTGNTIFTAFEEDLNKGFKYKLD